MPKENLLLWKITANHAYGVDTRPWDAVIMVFRPCQIISDVTVSFDFRHFRRSRHLAQSFNANIGGPRPANHLFRLDQNDSEKACTVRAKQKLCCCFWDLACPPQDHGKDVRDIAQLVGAHGKVRMQLARIINRESSGSVHCNFTRSDMCILPMKCASCLNLS